MKRIYLVTNLINGKQYVGQTKFTIEQRFVEHCYRGTYLHNAIIYYGSSNFKIELLEEVSMEEADIKENYFIHKYNTLYPNGYNLITGGISALRGHTKESRNNISEGVKNSDKHKRALWRYGKLTVIYNEVIIDFTDWDSVINFIVNNNISKTKNRHSIQTAINKGLLHQDGMCYGLKWSSTHLANRSSMG